MKMWKMSIIRSSIRYSTLKLGAKSKSSVNRYVLHQIFKNELKKVVEFHFMVSFLRDIIFQYWFIQRIGKRVQKPRKSISSSDPIITFISRINRFHWNRITSSSSSYFIGITASKIWVKNRLPFWHACNEFRWKFSIESILFKPLSWFFSPDPLSYSSMIWLVYHILLDLCENKVNANRSDCVCSHKWLHRINIISINLPSRSANCSIIIECEQLSWVLCCEIVL